jgi:putative phosphoesterase
MALEKIAVFSDTHCHDLALGIPYLETIMQTYAADASMVLHAGDVGDPDLLSAFTGLPVFRVLGNTDLPCPETGVQKTLVVNSFQIGLIHGWGSRREIESRVIESFSDPLLDVIVYGHSHWPVCQRSGRTLMFNPGSCMDHRGAGHYTFGILELGDTVTGRLINVDVLAQQFLRP